MGIDIEAIRRRMAELSGIKKTSNIQLWKPDLGEYKIRCIPWKDASDSEPFKERWFYYLGENQGILAPNQFGKPDPIHDLIRKLYSTGKQEDRTLARKLQPKMRAYAPIIVRGQEDKGVQVWSFGKMVYQRLLGFFVDEDYGNIIDPDGGYDLKVTFTKQPGKQFNDTTVDCARKPSKLAPSDEQRNKLLDSVPDLNDLYRLKSREEIETLLNSWLNGDTVQESATGSDGSSRGTKPADQLDAMINSISSQVTAVTPPTKKEPTQKKQTLDEAFEDLLSDEE